MWNTGDSEFVTYAWEGEFDMWNPGEGECVKTGESEFNLICEVNNMGGWICDVQVTRGGWIYVKYIGGEFKLKWRWISIDLWNSGEGEFVKFQLKLLTSTLSLQIVEVTVVDAEYVTVLGVLRADRVWRGSGLLSYALNGYGEVTAPFYQC